MMYVWTVFLAQNKFQTRGLKIRLATRIEFLTLL